VKLSMWTSFLMDLTPEEAIAEIGRLGWTDAELSTEHGKTLVERGNAEAAGREFRRHADACGVRVGQGHLDLFVNIGPAEEADRRRAVDGLKPWLDLYAAAGIVHAVIHPGRGPDSGDAKRPDAVLKSLAELIDHARGAPTIFCIENCPSGETVLRLLEATDPERTAVCLDTGHLNLTDEDPAAFIRRCGPRLRALHLAENDKSGDQHNMPFARGGSVPWFEIAAALREIRFAGALNYEIPGERACPLDVRRMKMDYLKRLTEWLFRAVE
jgi:sugar phosphate isomerase/epimerase